MGEDEDIPIVMEWVTDDDRYRAKIIHIRDLSDVSTIKEVVEKNAPPEAQRVAGYTMNGVKIFEADVKLGLLEKAHEIFLSGKHISGDIALILFSVFAVQNLYAVFFGAKNMFDFFTYSGAEGIDISLLTSMFAHANGPHLLINTFVFLSFGLIIEQYTSNREYLTLFILSGLVATMTHATIMGIFNQNMPIIGASGAISGMIGFLTIVKPKTKIMLFFLIPMPLYIGIGAFIVISVSLVFFKGLGAYGFAHTAHLGGLFFGLLYGIYSIRNSDES